MAFGVIVFLCLVLIGVVGVSLEAVSVASVSVVVVHNGAFLSLCGEGVRWW